MNQISMLGYHFRVFVHVEISTWPISPRKSWSCTSPNVFMWVMLLPLRWVSNCQCVRSFHNRNLGLNWVGQAVLVGLFIYVRENLGRWIMGKAKLKWAGWLSSHEMQLIKVGNCWAWWSRWSVTILGGIKESKCMVTLKHFPHERALILELVIYNDPCSYISSDIASAFFQKDLRIICFEKTRLTDEGTVQIGVGLQLGVGGLELGFRKSDMVYLTVTLLEMLCLMGNSHKTRQVRLWKWWRGENL